MQQGHGNALRFQINRQRTARHVQGHLGHAIAIGTTGAVVIDRPHPTGHQGQLRTGRHLRHQGSTELQRSQGIDLKLLPDGIHIEIGQSHRLENSGIENHQIETEPLQPLHQCRNGIGIGELHS